MLQESVDNNILMKVLLGITLLALSTCWTIETHDDLATTMVENGTEHWKTLNLTTPTTLAYREIVYTDEPDPPKYGVIKLWIEASQKLQNDDKFAVACLTANADKLKVVEGDEGFAVTLEQRYKALVITGIDIVEATDDNVIKKQAGAENDWHVENSTAKGANSDQVNLKIKTKADGTKIGIGWAKSQQAKCYISEILSDPFDMTIEQKLRDWTSGEAKTINLGFLDNAILATISSSILAVMLIMY